MKTVLTCAALMFPLAAYADSNAALSDACQNGGERLIIGAAFNGSDYTNHPDADTYIAAVEDFISPRVLHPLGEALCVLLSIENDRYRRAMVRGLLTSAEVADVEGFDKFVERLSTRLSIYIPSEILTPLRAEISVAQIRVDAENSEIRADLAAQNRMVSELELRLTEMDKIIETKQAALAEAQAALAEAQAALAEAQAELERLYALRDEILATTAKIEALIPQ